jgi:hypothetical protein
MNQRAGSSTGAIAMSVVGWMSLGRMFRSLWTGERKPRTHGPQRRTSRPSLECLEGIALLSTVRPLIDAAAVRLHSFRHHLLATPVTKPQGSQASAMAATSTPVTLAPQTLSLGNTLTNFTNQPLSPALKLFDPSLGTLTSVVVIHASTLQSTITSRNLSSTSATVITANFSASYQINGLNQAIVQPTRTVSSQPQPAGPFGSGTDSVTFPPLQLPGSSLMTFTDPASLAFFTAAPGRATITATMTATGTGSASAPNGNLLTVAQTSASATVTVSYTYLPPSPPPPTPCPTPGTIGRIGLHHQRTLLILSFNGAVSPTLAGRASDYSVITSTGQRIPIVSAHYNPATNSVTLIPARRLNVHLHFRLSAVLPCPNGQSGGTVILPFGGRRSLVGFHDRRGQFVPVQDGRIEKFPVRARGSR